MELLPELAKQADLEGRYTTTLATETYAQYGDSGEENSPHTPFAIRPEHRNQAVQDVQATLARIEKLNATWPTPKGEGVEPRNRATAADLSTTDDGCSKTTDGRR